jgi:hypothetical protein
MAFLWPQRILNGFLFFIHPQVVQTGKFEGYVVWIIAAESVFGKVRKSKGTKSVAVKGTGDVQSTNIRGAKIFTFQRIATW